MSYLRLQKCLHLHRNGHDGEVRDLHLLIKHGGYRHGGGVAPIVVLPNARQSW